MNRRISGCLFALLITSAASTPARAQDVLCDTSFENCRVPLIDLIRNEQVGIDAAWWFMTDARYTNELIRKWQQGVPVRIIIDVRANSTYSLNADRLEDVADAGIPMRQKTSSGILHWKAMIFAGQSVVQFSAANYSPFAFVPEDPYRNYTDEVIYFSAVPSVVNSFLTKFDDLWVNTSGYANYANITGPLTRQHPTLPKDPELNFPPRESFRSRSRAAYNDETQQIDAIMFRITDRQHTDALIAALGRGVRVRLITDWGQYTWSERLWHSWNVDRLWRAGAEIRVAGEHKNRPTGAPNVGHEGTVHQKSTLLYSQGMTIFGSSNWTSPSSDSQEEHNYFTKRPEFFQFFRDQFERKWNNSNPIGALETEAFEPLPPDPQNPIAPADGASGVSTSSVTFSWGSGIWTHLYDLYLGTDPNPPLLVADRELGPSLNANDAKGLTANNLLPGTTYYWRVVGKTMAGLERSSAIRTFTTAGTAEPPPPSGTPGPGDILIYASRATRHGNWTVVNDATAAGGMRLENPDQGQGKINTALAAPADYAELTFTAEAGVAYRLWLRGRAHGDHWSNDSAHIQFSGSVTASGAPVYRIGTTSSTVFNLEQCSGCGLANWGWEDNGWGIDVMGPPIYFETTGTQTIRFQPREDGLSIDQVLLSPEQYLDASPGAFKNDTTILPESEGGAQPPPPSNSGEVVLYASKATIVGADWHVISDPAAAGGQAIHNPDEGRPKVNTALASPASYIELAFQAETGRPYRLWIRGRAQNNHWGNDSVHVQFSNAVTAGGAATYRIGTTSSTEINLEECIGCGVSGWGWEDNGWGAVDALGPEIYFASSGPQTLRIQTREDGFVIDQVVLSPETYLHTRPGTAKNDATILPESDGTGP